MKLSKRHWFIMMIVVSAAFMVTIIATATVHASRANDDTKELQLLHVIIRHGSRTPQSTYPKDPYINETFFPTGWGQLTNGGKLELYELGIYLRSRYGQFLGEFYVPDEYYTQSTDVDRTKASVEVVNAGLWPPKESQKWGPLEWQPIPVHAEPLESDSLLLVRSPCPQYHLELERLKNTSEIQNKFNENRQLFQNLTTITGQIVEDFDGVQDIYSTLTAEKASNLTLPDWTEEYYPNKMLEPTIFSYILNSYTQKLQRLKGGVLLKKLINDWKSKEENSIKQKAFLYGGHDSTIVNILRALNVWDPQLPGYGITILFEFSRDVVTGHYGLQVYLKNSTVAPPYLLTIPGCESFCSLSSLLELTTDVIPIDWDAECATSEDYTVPPAELP